jgi:hypothetical protein
LNEVEQFLAYARRLLEADPSLCPCPDPRSAGAMIAFLSGLAAAWEVEKLRATGETESVRQAMRDGFAQGVRDGILGMGAGNGAA